MISLLLVCLSVTDRHTIFFGISKVKYYVTI
nr:MAG TPA: hypothetical protein [Caudoviricetes sp.]